MDKSVNVIVFGGSGFLGSHVADSLTRKGYAVTIFDIKESPYLQESQKMLIGDILDPKQIDDAIKANDIVYNFAGIADIDECHAHPIDTIKYNILGNAQILQSSVKNNIKKYLFASSAYVYSTSGSYYRISKQSSELFVESFSEESKMDYVILRYGSLYGDRADNRNSLHRIIETAVREGKIEYFGDGTETREYIHVKDAADLSVEALNDNYINEILMLTGTKSIKYSDLLSMINEMFSNKIDIKLFSKKSKTHFKMSPYSFNPKMAKKLVSNPHIDFGQGLLNLIEEIHSKLNSQFKNDYR